MPDEQYTRVASLAELQEKVQIPIEVGEDEILLVWMNDNVYAIGNICTHDEVWLDDGDLYPETCEIECPMHEGRFDLRTGAATHEPCETPVPSYPVQIEGDDVLIGPAAPLAA